MDAHALLTSQGWRGTGHSLHPSSDSTGLAKPLLVAQKKNNLGVGKKQHKTSDMWWMNAFDKTLKGLDTSKDGTVVQNVTNGGLDMVVRGGARFVGNSGGLYASFVRGECLSGTITPEETVEESKTKRRRKNERMEETREERRARKAAKRAAKARDSPMGEVSQKEEREGDTHEIEETEDVVIGALEEKDESKESKRQKKLLQQAERETARILPEKAKKKKRRKD